MGDREKKRSVAAADSTKKSGARRESLAAGLLRHVKAKCVKLKIS